MYSDKISELKQREQHGRPTFPFAVYQTCIPQYITEFPPHWHNEIEIIFMHKGICTHVVNNEQVILRDGEMLFISPTVVHSYKQYNDESCYASVFVFDLDLVTNKLDLPSQKYFNPMIMGRCNDYFVVSPSDLNYRKYCKVIEGLLIHFLQRTSVFELEIKKHLFELFILAFNDEKIIISHDPNTYSNSNIVKQVINYIEDNYGTDITLETLSDIAGVSTFRLSHLFKEITGKSCIDYVIDYRLSVVADKLKNTDEAITSIAIGSGFNNISNFNYAFKKKYKTTPSNYRKTKKRQL